MRMWHIQLIPFLCAKHLVGMHGEIHKHRHNFVKKHSIKGRVEPVVQIEPELMKQSHDLCTKYLKNHKSPYKLPNLSYLPEAQRKTRVSLEENIKTLNDRCPVCKKNFKNAFKKTS